MGPAVESFYELEEIIKDNMLNVKAIGIEGELRRKSIIVLSWERGVRADMYEVEEMRLRAPTTMTEENPMFQEEGHFRGNRVGALSLE